MNQWSVRRPKEPTAFKNKILRRDGEEKKGGLQMGKKTWEMSKLPWHFSYSFFEQFGQRKPMHLGSTYLILSKPKDFPIHFICTNMYICYIYIYLDLSLVYTDICVEGGVHLQIGWPFSRKSNQP